MDPSPIGESAPEYPPDQNPESIPLDQGRKVHQEPIQVPVQEYSDDDERLSDHSFPKGFNSTNTRMSPVKFSAGEHSRKPRAVSSPNTLVFPSVMQAVRRPGSVPSSNAENGPPTPVLMYKKTNVSPSISSRIKALEKFSSLEDTSAGPPPAVTWPSTPRRFTSAQSENRHGSPHIPRNMRCANSIPVTTHIVRDADTFPGSFGVQLSKSDVHSLQTSPLVVAYETTVNPSRESTAEPVMHPEDRSTPVLSSGSDCQAPSSPTSLFSVSSCPKTNETSQSASLTSPKSEDKKASSASALTRRASNTTSPDRGSILEVPSSPVKEEGYAHISGNGFIKAPGAAGLRASEPIDIGVVNVQFPETCLWKRRSMRIDGNGYIVLMSGADDATARNVTKTYHLTEFRTPYVPDDDIQELPNSVLLDFLDGRSLQCACDSRQGQGSALQALVDAYNIHHR